MLYKLDSERIESSSRVPIRSPADLGLKEKDIENFLKSRLPEVVSEDKLMLIGQERPFQEEADLLALDEGGVLYIFELKRSTSEPKNLLQVMRYGQIFGQYTYRQLENLANKQQGLDDGSALKARHKIHFDLDKELSEKEFNQDQVFVLVTNGMDSNTISAVKYWSKKGVRITCSPYRVYRIENAPYIQFDTYDPDAEVLSEENVDSYIVNTNSTFMSGAWKDMIGDCFEGKAAAYYDRKWSVCKITMNSHVYLYHNKVGIIAKGVAKSTYQKADCNGDKDEEFFVELKFDWALQEDAWPERAPTPWEINQKLRTGHRFRQTVFAINEAMAKAIDSIKTKKETGG